MVSMFSDSTNAFVQAQLYGFTYTTDLDDKTSPYFLRLQSRFCADVSRFFIGLAEV
ncbi:hypothetical protein DPMN_141474 [Dreissena polymorpha]|uniref:Uncharacterized protein n=1 Tax=Dreissena polymorpha TaxID=45954 RepID=A0A9D4GCQ7_DREPO|nr:hypothetical protein DPMN_141474 [Dreissena polymorpha]